LTGGRRCGGTSWGGLSGGNGRVPEVVGVSNYQIFYIKVKI
jgi:hypothetical protein